MKHLNKTILFALCCSLFICITGCEDELEVEVPSSIVFGQFPTNGEEAQALLHGAYREFKEDYNSTYYHEDRGDGFEVGVIGSVSNAWNHDITATNGNSWTGFYGALNNINYLLSLADDLSFSSEDNRNQLKAEALYLRASYYFFMAKIWGDVPLILEPILSADVEVIGRTPVDEVFAQINSDISTAISLFPNDGIGDKKFASKPAANALLADVKMWTGKVLGGGTTDFDEALSAISSIESQGLSLLGTFADVFDNKKNDEVIFSVYNDFNELTSHYASRLSVRDVNYDPVLSPGIPGSSDFAARHNYSPSAKLRSLFSDPNDVRADRTFLPFFTAPGTPPDSYSQSRYYGEIIDGNRVYEDDYIIYRWADMLLLRAEAYAAKNDIPNAIIALDEVRNRAGIGDYTGATDQQSVNIEILDERGRELFLESKRWWDLRRFHADGTIDVYTYIPNLIGQTTPLYWSVSTDIITLNPLIEQTNGY
jgi:hypothetical protein